MDKRAIELASFDAALDLVRREFPLLHVEVDRDHDHVDAFATISAQPGLRFEVTFNLQNRDELHLCASHLWVEWFPCGKPEVFDQFADAVVGLLAGRYRILESFLFDRCVNARLQRPSGVDAWETVNQSSSFPLAMVPWKRSVRVVQNVP
jgi:hypothetical protein